MNPAFRLPRRRALALAAGALAAPGVARAAWPERAIRLVVPYGGGGQTDIVSRVTAEALGRALGQPVLVDNRPGGAGNTAAEAVARAPADGYTLLVATAGTNSGLNALMYRQLGYDWQRISRRWGGSAPPANVLLVHRSIPGDDFPAVHRLDPRATGPVHLRLGRGRRQDPPHHGGGRRAAGLEMVHVPSGRAPRR